MTAEDLSEMINDMHDQGWIHIRRGFRLNEAPKDFVGNHVIEEAVEMQAEVLHGNPIFVLKEMSDLFAAQLHLLGMYGFTLQDLVDATLAGLHDNFTMDPGKVTSTKPGFNRSNRVALGDRHALDNLLADGNSKGDILKGAVAKVKEQRAAQLGAALEDIH